MREHRLHDGLGRARLQVVKPAAKHVRIVVVVGNLRGHGEQVERSRHDVRLQPSRVLGLAREVPH